jgi:hypothetical protein
VKPEEKREKREERDGEEKNLSEPNHYAAIYMRLTSIKIMSRHFQHYYRRRRSTAI